MKALLAGSAQELQADRDRSRPKPGPGEALVRVHRIGHLRDRHQRLPRQDAVLQLSANPGPRARRRGGRGRRGRDQRQAGRPLLGRAVHQRPEQLRQPPRPPELLREARGARRPPRRRDAAPVPRCRPASCTPRTKLAFEQLALVETLAIGCHAVNRGDAQADESCLVIGAGPIGLATLEFVKLTGARTIVLDMNEQRLDFCKRTMGVAAHDQGLRTPREGPPRRDRRPPARRRDRRDRLERLDVERLRPRSRPAAGSSTSGITTDEVKFRHPVFHKTGGDAPLLAERPAGRLHADHRADRGGPDRHEALDHPPRGLRRAARRLPVVHEARDRRDQGRSSRSTDSRGSVPRPETRPMTTPSPEEPGSPACVTLGLSPSFGFGDRIGLATPGPRRGDAPRRRGDRADLPAAVDPRDGPDRPHSRAGDGRRAGRDAAGRLDRPDRRRRRPPEDARRTSTRRPPSASRSSRSTRPTTSTPTPTTTTSRPSATKFAAVAGEVGWIDRYRGKSVKLATGTTVELDEQACLRAAVKYGRALNHAICAGRPHRSASTSRPVATTRSS